MAQGHNLMLPSWAVSLSDAIARPIGSHVNVVGLVTEVFVPKITRTNEWMITFDLCDHGLMLRTGEWKGITVRYFRKKIAELPIPHIGDVIMIRNIKRSIYNNTPMLMSSWNTQSMNFGEESVPNSDGTIENVDSRKTIHCVCIPVEKRPSQEDQVYAMELKNTFGQAVMSSIPPHLLIHNLAELQGFAHQYLSDHGSASGAPVTPGPQRQPSSPTTASSATSHSATAPTPWHKFALVQDVQVNKFHDLTVEVVKIFANKYGDSVDMYVTDYTSHKELYDYPSPEESAKEGGDGDAYGYIATRHEGFPGPWGQRVLLVEVRQPHMSYLMQSVKVGDFVDIRNVRIKISRAGRLEGNMWLDNKFPDKVGITKIKPGSNEESRGVVERRTAYWSAREQQPQQEKKMGKKERKKRKRAEDKARAAEDSKMSKLDAVVASSGYVRTAHRDIPLTTLSSLLEKHGQWRWEGKDEELPFVNQRRRCQLQAIDYYPPRLRDFARPRVQTKADDFVGSDGDMDMDEQGWEWDFFLLVRDPIPRGAPTKSSAQTWLHVSNTAAQYLLKMDASDLDEEPASLNELSHKMDILCGNLRELKDEQLAEACGKPDHADMMSRLSNLPFECCIEEYGWPKDDIDKSPGDSGWVRMFAMFETTIN